MSGRPRFVWIGSIVVHMLGATVRRRAGLAFRRAAPALGGAALALACSPAPPVDTPSISPSADGTSAASTASATASGHAGANGTATPSASAPPLPPVSLVPVDRTRLEGKPPVLGVVAPAKNTVIPTAKAAAFEVRVSAKGWKPAAGEHLCVVLDKRPCKRVEDPSKAVPLGEMGPLEEGQHVVSVVARHATGEVLRTGKAAPFASVSFFVGKKVPLVYKEGSPMLIYSAPDKGPAPGEGVLIDFFLANAEVRSGNFVIAATVGGPGIESGVGLVIETDRPVRIKNARPGEYLSRLTLLEFVPDLGESKSATTVTYKSRPAVGPFVEVERSIFVTK